MVFKPLPRTRMLSPVPGERYTNRSGMVLVFFFTLYFAQLLLQFGVAAGVNAFYRSNGLNIDMTVMRFVRLITSTIMCICVLAWCLKGERRTLGSMGLTGRGASLDYLIGILIGFSLFTGAVLICRLPHAIKVFSSAQPPAIGWILLFLVAFMIQGLAEEMLCRSFLLVSLSRTQPLWLAIVTNAVLFALLHMRNPGINAIALFNIFLFGLFASVLTLRRGNIWMAAAIHTMWNFTQGNLFGVPVSGFYGLPSPLYSKLETDPLSRLFNGGTFGLEGGLGVTLILLAAIFVVAVIPTPPSARADAPAL